MYRAVLLVLVLCCTFVNCKFCDKIQFRKAEKQNFKQHFNETVEEYQPLDYIAGVKYEEVKILKLQNQNINHLCRGSVEGDFDIFVLNYSELEYIEPGALVNGNKAYLVDLGSNNITEIKSGIFSGTNIISINLMNNDISDIDSTAFDNMPMLEVLNLSVNKLSTWDIKWFKNAKNLHRILLPNNTIEELPENTFQNLEGIVYITLDLENNLIKSIHPKAFKDIRIFGKLDLSSNEINQVSEEWFKDFVFFYGIDLSDNKIESVPKTFLLSLENVVSMDLNGNPLTNRSKDEIEKFYRFKIHKSVFINPLTRIHDDDDV